MLPLVHKLLLAAAFMAAVAAPLGALATTVDATMIPDGTYTVTVEKVQDPSHLLVRMQTGVETTLVARAPRTFTAVKANETLKVSIIKGQVPVFAIE